MASQKKHPKQIVIGGVRVPYDSLRGTWTTGPAVKKQASIVKTKNLMTETVKSAPKEYTFIAKSKTLKTTTCDSSLNALKKDYGSPVKSKVPLVSEYDSE